MYSGDRHASALAPKGFEDLSPRQFAEREADMATSNALYQKAWDAGHFRGQCRAMAGTTEGRRGTPLEVTWQELSLSSSFTVTKGATAPRHTAHQRGPNVSSPDTCLAISSPFSPIAMMRSSS